MDQSGKHINPSFRKKAKLEYSFQECLDGLDQGNFGILAYLISKAESKLLDDQKLVRQVLMHSKAKEHVRKIAISGSPGVGKSSFIDSFGSFLVANNQRIAVLPVDPSSYISKGSILGDKTRMETLSRSENAFIKPMASALVLGGLAPSSSVAVMLCERSSFDYIILETVGVGQSEVEARDIVDMFILLLQAGGGDDLQGIKRGIMELADLFVVTKADGSLLSNANQTARQIKQISSLLAGNGYGWYAPVKTHSAINNEGNEHLKECIEDYYRYMQNDDKLNTMRLKQNSKLFEKQSRELIVQHLLKNPKIASALESIKSKLEDNQLNSIEALKALEDTLDES